MSNLANTNRRPGGLTLLELLVVLFIVSILLAVSIPVFRTNVGARAVRESSRILSTALNTARQQARLTGRPTGIRFEPLPSSPWGAADIHFVEVPPAYAGDYTNSRIRFVSWQYMGVAPDTGKDKVKFGVVFPQGDAWTSFVSVGDLLELNNQQQTFRVEPPTNTNWLTLSGDFVFASGPQLIYPRLTSTDVLEPEYSFRFIRRPVESSLPPIQLPAGAAVDLQMSGWDSNHTFYDSGNPQPSLVMITLAPTGEPYLVYHPVGTGTDGPGSAAVSGVPLTDKIHFLVGKVGKYGAENLIDLENIWVSVTGQSGAITSTENGAVYDGGGNVYETPPATIDPDVHVRDARVWAQSGQSMAGQ